MKALLPKHDVSGAIYHADTKELAQTLNVVGYKAGELHEILTVRWYMARAKSASVVHCNIWVHGGAYVSGSGHAGGYGYHKPSAAFQAAMDRAGIVLKADRNSGDQYGRELGDRKPYICHVDGCGDRSVDLACEAIARALGYRKVLIVKN